MARASMLREVKCEKEIKTSQWKFYSPVFLFETNHVHGQNLPNGAIQAFSMLTFQMKALHREVSWVCRENNMSFYTVEYKSDHMIKNRPIRWIW